jgi:transcriptional regulator with XRE-family HTH domain
MPTRPTTPEQREDAAKLKAIYQAWLDSTPPGQKRRVQEDVAEAIGTSQSTVAQTINGKLALNPRRAAKFAALFGCSVVEVKSYSTAAEPQVSAYSTGLTLGSAAAELAATVADLPKAHRAAIAAAMSTMLTEGPDPSLAAVIDSLAGGRFAPVGQPDDFDRRPRFDVGPGDSNFGGLEELPPAVKKTARGGSK